MLNQLFEKCKELSDHELSEAFYKDLGGVTGPISNHTETVETPIRRELGAREFSLCLRDQSSLVHETIVLRFVLCNFRILTSLRASLWLISCA